MDLEHWAAFHDSFEELAALLRSVGSGERSNRKPPASVVVLSGDVHHGYLAEVDFGDGVESPVYQAVGSPLEPAWPPRTARHALRLVRFG